MTVLADLQNAFGKFLLDGDSRFSDAVVSTQELDAHARLQIYGNAYRTRFTEVLSTDFPVLRIVLGDGPFERLSAEYIAACPSRSFTLRDFGARFPSFVESRSALEERAFAAELAAFEWAFVEAFDAVDQTAVGVADMAQIPPDAWPRLEIGAHPSVQTVTTRFNTLNVWNAAKAELQLPAAMDQTDTVACLVWRKDLTCVFRSMERTEFAAWSTVARGANFAVMCDALLDWLPADEIPLRAATLLRTWLVDGLIGALRTP
jgi:hypothetical protein